MLGVGLMLSLVIINSLRVECSKNLRDAVDEGFVCDLKGRSLKQLPETESLTSFCKLLNTGKFIREVAFSACLSL